VRVVETSPDLLASEIDALFREARRRRRRRYLTFAGIVALLAGLLLLVLSLVSAGGRGDGDGNSSSPRSLRPPSAKALPPSETAPVGGGLVGQGPTTVDFTGPEHGWIASGNVALPQGNPTIVRTINGGQTWVRTPVPNVAAQSINSATRYQLGALVGVHFASQVRGWYFQAGIGWQTNDAGSTWTKMRFPAGGMVVALTSSGSDVWALVDTCPIGAVSCPQAMGRGSIFHAQSARELSWHRVGAPLPTGTDGDGTLLPTPDHGVVAALGYETYRRSVSGSTSAAPVTGCQPVGALTGDAVAGLCGPGGGGNASVSTLSVSNDLGTSWQHLIDGPPSGKFIGQVTTNGSDAVFYVTGGQTLWRTGTSQPGWRAVLQVPSDSTDEIYPVYVQGEHGLALVSGGTDAHWFETSDGGLTWEPMSLP
jgi:hypothetical protein